MWVVAAWVAFVPSALIVFTYMTLGMVFSVDGLERDPWVTIGLVSLGVFVVSGVCWFLDTYGLVRGQPPRHARKDDAAPTMPRWGYIAGLIWWALFLIGVPAVRVADVLDLSATLQVILGSIVYPAWFVASAVWVRAMVIEHRRAKHARSAAGM
jgi:small-conductance mechanosensitive channel